MSYSTTESVKVALSQHQKFHKARELALELATLVSEGGMQVYEERLSLLQIIKSKWLNSEHLTLTSGNFIITIISICML